MQRPSEDWAKMSVSIAGKLAPSPSVRFVFGYDIKLLHKKGGTHHGKAVPTMGKQVLLRIIYLE